MEGAIKIAEKGDYKKAYKDFCDFESGFSEDCRNDMTFEEFMTEFKKGYGNSGCVQIARLFENDNGIFYDLDYC